MNEKDAQIRHIGGCVCPVCKGWYPPPSWYAKKADRA